MQSKTITTDVSTTRTLIAATRMMCPPGALLEGSLAFVRLALRGGATPAFVFVFEPTMTPELKVEMDRWSTDPDVTFNTMVVMNEVATLLKAPRFTGR